jgi:hypothetical protein
MDDLAMWSLLVGSVLPPLVAILEQPKWPDWLRSVVAVLSSLVAGFVTTWIVEGGDDLFERGLVTAVLLVLVSSLTTYRNFWKPTTLAPQIEAKTSP